MRKAFALFLKLPICITHTALFNLIKPSSSTVDFKGEFNNVFAGVFIGVLMATIDLVFVSCLCLLNLAVFFKMEAALSPSIIL